VRLALWAEAATMEAAAWPLRYLGWGLVQAEQLERQAWAKVAWATVWPA